MEGSFKSEAARLGMGAETGAKTLPPRCRLEAVADSGDSAVLRVLSQG